NKTSHRIVHFARFVEQFTIGGVNILVARLPAEIDLAYSRLGTSAVLGCDTETSSLNPKYGKLFSIQFSDGEFNVLIPISEGIDAGPFITILSDPAIVKIFHNAKFDTEFLREGGITVQNVFDTMIAEKVLTRGANQSASLAETLYRYFAVDLEKSHRSKFNKSWNGVWTDELVDYALSDVVHLPTLRREQMAWMERLGLTAEFESQMRKLY
ncbi:MAG: ribonuclease D, partial [Acidobacteria bacterium]|nr:ribonuclease D [Acidobacteriota bacterium]MCA1608774.1 ribonuclease D [Acidobacteriota bacterium]